MCCVASCRTQTAQNEPKILSTTCPRTKASGEVRHNCSLAALWRPDVMAGAPTNSQAHMLVPHLIVRERTEMYAHIFGLLTIERAARHEAMSALCQVDRCCGCCSLCDGNRGILRPLQLPAHTADICTKPVMCIESDCRPAVQFRGASEDGRSLACEPCERNLDRLLRTRCAFY